MKCIITVLGTDKVGIIAKVCTYLSDVNINILDISQTIVDGYFNMMMITDTSMCSKKISVISEELDAVGTEIGVIIHAQLEDIFTKMHRI